MPYVLIIPTIIYEFFPLIQQDPAIILRLMDKKSQPTHKSFMIELVLKFSSQRKQKVREEYGIYQHKYFSMQYNVNCLHITNSDLSSAQP